MTPADGVPGIAKALRFSTLSTLRVSHQARPPPTRLPPIVAESQPRVLPWLWLGL